MPRLRPSFLMIGLLLVLSAWICSDPPPPPDRVAIETHRLRTLTPTPKATPTIPPTSTSTVTPSATPTPTPTPTETPTSTFTPPPAPTLPPPTLTARLTSTPLPTQNVSDSGDTEIKIWQEGLTEPADVSWVKVE